MREITVVVNSRNKKAVLSVPECPALAKGFADLTPGDVLADGRDYAVCRAGDGRVSGVFWDADGDPWTAKVTFTALPAAASFVIRRYRMAGDVRTEVPEKTLRRYANSAGILEVKIPAEAGEVMVFAQE